jgi:signal transduction histidine kinase
VMALARGEMVKNGIVVQSRLADNLPSIEGDRVQLQQVVLNLILNAVEAMSSAGDETRELSISTEPNQHNGILLSVRDTGPGIDPVHLEEVFQPFHTTKSSGLGMGLAICRSIIEAHGGRLWASANVPHGAVMQLVVPVRPGDGS